MAPTESPPEATVAIPMTISGNTITANGNSGIINADPTALITGNIVSGKPASANTASTATAQIHNNIVFDNYIGMYANGGSAPGQPRF